MIADLKLYPEYKESGSRWLAHVPLHWEVRNLRTLIRPRKERDRSDLPLLSVARERGVFVRSLTDADENHNVIPENLSNYKVARAGNLVINKMKAWQGSMGIAPCDGIVSPAYFVFDFGIANRAFGQALLRSKPYVSHFGQASDGVRVGQWDLTIPGMRQIPVLMPPPAEQAAIVRFLDWANGRLERAIRAKRKVIALLNEQKQAIIHRAVTRGLDPSVPLKPSGIPWLGDIPQHWDVMRTKMLAHIKTGGRDTVDRIDNAPYPFFVRSQTVERIDSYSFDGEAVLTAGDGAGVAKVFHYINGKFDYHQRVYKFSSFKRVSGLFFFFYLKSTLRFEALDASAKSTVDSLRLPLLQNFPTLVPPGEEQLAIVNTIKAETSGIDKAMSRVGREIDLLREYRTRLVADVVTGKLDVREAAARLPEEALPETIENATDLDDEINPTDEEADE